MRIYIRSKFESDCFCLTNQSRVTYMRNLLRSSLSPVQRQATIWDSAGSLWMRSLGSNISKTWIQIQCFACNKMHFKRSPETWKPFCPGHKVLNNSNSRCNIQRSSYQWKDSRYKDETVVRPSYLYNGNYFIGKTISSWWYWIGFQLSTGQSKWRSVMNSCWSALTAFGKEHCWFLFFRLWHLLFTFETSTMARSICR